jgi:hypothetical protein
VSDKVTDPLDTQQTAKGSVNKDWGLIVNGWIRSHGQGRSTFYTIDDALMTDETKLDDNN